MSSICLHHPNIVQINIQKMPKFPSWLHLLQTMTLFEKVKLCKMCTLHVKVHSFVNNAAQTHFLAVHESFRCIWERQA